MDSVFLKGNRGHLSENLSTKNTALIWWIHQYQIGAFFTSSEKLKKALKPQKETRGGKNADGQQTKISVECRWTANKNFRRMRMAYLAYADFPEEQAKAWQLGWTANVAILEGCVAPEERSWYLGMPLCALDGPKHSF